jgi:AcrR family transcriptional regulator
MVDTRNGRTRRVSTRVRFPAGGLWTARSQTMAPQARKSTQRERLLGGMVEAANRSGYAGANVSAVIAQAGVSRPTFYDYFEDRDDCFTATIDDVNAELLEAVRVGLNAAEPGETLQAAVSATLEFAARHTRRARFLMAESMSGGRRALEARDRGIEMVAELVEQAQAKAAPATQLPDIDPRIVLGAVHRMIATRLRRGEPAVTKLAGELHVWLAAYRTGANEGRWGKLEPGPVPATALGGPAVPIGEMPALFPPGRTRLEETEIAENHRLRILWAAARLAAEKGYLASTVAEITRLARVDGRVFYRLFSDKQEAFAAAHELGFQHVMDVTAKGFFGAVSWPERAWEAGRALTQLLQEYPMLAHVGFVEAYAVGPATVQRIEDSHVAFIFFLQEGLLQVGEQPPPSRVAMEAIIAAVFEVLYLQARRGEDTQVAGMLGQIAHLWLAPFLGVPETNAFIASRLNAQVARRRRKR